MMTKTPTDSMILLLSYLLMFSGLCLLTAAAVRRHQEKEFKNLIYAGLILISAATGLIATFLIFF